MQGGRAFTIGGFYGGCASSKGNDFFFGPAGGIPRRSLLHIHSPEEAKLATELLKALGDHVC